MKNYSPEMIEKAKAVKTAEELLALAKENGIEMTAENAKAYFEQLHPASGELSDNELDNVAGGGCKTSDGHTVVTSGKACFTGQFECAYEMNGESLVWKRSDNLGLRATWESYCCLRMTPEGSCGRCIHLEFDAGTGYCGVS